MVSSINPANAGQISQRFIKVADQDGDNKVSLREFRALKNNNEDVFLLAGRQEFFETALSPRLDEYFSNNPDRPLGAPLLEQFITNLATATPEEVPLPPPVETTDPETDPNIDPDTTPVETGPETEPIDSIPPPEDDVTSPIPVPTPAMPAGTFRLSMDQVSNLITASDGLQPYTVAGWERFPELTSNHWGIGFTNQLTLSNARRGATDGALSFDEKNLAAQQLAWDRTQGLAFNDGTINGTPIDSNLASQSQTFLGSIFWNNATTSPPGQAGTIRSGLDANGDGQFTMADVDALKGLDGDASTLSSDDFEALLLG